MNFRCVLTIIGEKKPQEQLSPLCFKTAQECLDFGRAFFEPPQTVLSCRIEKTDKLAKFRFKNGKLEFI